MPDQLVRALLDPPTVRVVSALTTDTAREATRRHGTVGAGTVVLGRSLTAGLLLATLTKGEERVTMQIAGDGPIRLVTIDADDEGNVRGYLSPHGVAAALGDQRRPQVGPAIGRGSITVVRDLGLKDQYRGSASIVTGEIDEDVEAYLRQSEQLDSALGCEVLVGQHGDVVASGGLLVQAMPGGEPELIREAQHALRTGVLYRALAKAREPIDLALAVLGDRPISVLDRRTVRFRCRCSLERARSMLALLDLDEIDEMLAKDGQAEITCNFCSERYILDRDALTEVRARVAELGPRERN